MLNDLPLIAKWEHILNVYKWDKQKIVRLLYKLKDVHLAPVAQDKMKVSLAAQVMSHTVAATLNSFACTGKEHCSTFIICNKEQSDIYECNLVLSVIILLSDFTMVMKFTTM
jgi:hypothetical protein